ncbi:MAG: hypothetical protein HUU03_03770 [Planctomycetaceae bacterium]|nr:hypothetical protein [Planctomycetaceae bacterium]
MAVAFLSAPQSSAQSKETSPQSGPWQIVETRTVVLRLNTQSGATFVLRDLDGANPRWDVVSEPNPQADVPQADMWSHLQYKSKIVVDDAGKVVGLAIGDKFNFENTELKAGDVIVEANQSSITSGADLSKAVRLAKNDKKDEIEIVYLREGTKHKTKQKIVYK